MSLPEIISLSDTGHLGHHENLHRRFNEGWVSVTDHGAVGDGVTDDTAAIAAANTAVTAAGGTLHFPPGTYRILSTVTLTCNVEADPDAILLVDAAAANPGVIVGDTTHVPTRVHLPQVIQNTQVWTAGAIGTDVGVRIVRGDASIFTVPHVKYFSVGLELRPDSASELIFVGYSTFNIGFLENNAVNLRLAPQDHAWVNQNAFIGGRYQHYLLEGADLADVMNLELRDDGTYHPDGNTFVNPSLESNVAQWHLYCNGGHNTFIGPRFESLTGGKVYWGEHATDNLIVGGYATDPSTAGFVAHASAYNNHILGSNGFWSEFTANPGIVLRNPIGSVFAVLAVLPYNKSPWNDDPTTEWVFQVSAASLKAKATADAHARAQLDSTTGWLRFGAGSATPAMGVYHSAGSPEGTITAAVGAIYLQSNSAAGTPSVWSKETGTGNTGWQLLRPRSAAAYTPSNVTADRGYDADTVVVAELADVVGTLIADLQALDVIQ